MGSQVFQQILYRVARVCVQIFVMSHLVERMLEHMQRVLENDMLVGMVSIKERIARVEGFIIQEVKWEDQLIQGVLDRVDVYQRFALLDNSHLLFLFLQEGVIVRAMCDG